MYDKTFLFTKRANSPPTGACGVRLPLQDEAVAQQLVSTMDVEQRVASLEVLVLACCQGTDGWDDAEHTRSTGSWVVGKCDGVDWGPWQSAVPATLLELQCRATRRIQHWWRDLKLKRRRRIETIVLQSVGGPLAFLTIKDVCALFAASLAHTVALEEAGYGGWEFSADDRGQRGRNDDSETYDSYSGSSWEDEEEGEEEISHSSEEGSEKRHDVKGYETLRRE